MEDYIVTLMLTDTNRCGHVTVTESELLNIGIRDSVEDKFGIGVEFTVNSVAKR